MEKCLPCLYLSDPFPRVFLYLDLFASDPFGRVFTIHVYKGSLWKSDYSAWL